MGGGGGQRHVPASPRGPSGRPPAPAAPGQRAARPTGRRCLRHPLDGAPRRRRAVRPRRHGTDDHAVGQTQPSLKITNPYELTQKQFDASVALLKQQRANIGQYWSDYTKEQAAFAQGDSVLGTTWQVITNLLLADKVKVKAILPAGGST